MVAPTTKQRRSTIRSAEQGRVTPCTTSPPSTRHGIARFAISTYVQKVQLAHVQSGKYTNHHIDLQNKKKEHERRTTGAQYRQKKGTNIHIIKTITTPQPMLPLAPMQSMVPLAPAMQSMLPPATPMQDANNRRREALPSTRHRYPKNANKHVEY